MFSKHRIEALSDAVFAIAMTLLILDIKVPAETGPGGLAAALRAEGHEWVSFVVTFAITAIFWTFQHQVFDLLDTVGKESLAITFLFLGFVTVLPFSTALWGHHLAEPLACILYFANQCVIGLALTWKLERARAAGHLRSAPETGTLRIRLWVLCIIMGCAAFASWLLPIQDLVWVIVPIAAVGRLLRFRQKRLHPARSGTSLTSPHEDQSSTPSL